RIAFTWFPVADLWHIIEPLIRLWRVVVLTEPNLERRKRRMQFALLQADPAQFRNERQALLAPQEPTILLHAGDRQSVLSSLGPFGSPRDWIKELNALWEPGS